MEYDFTDYLTGETVDPDDGSYPVVTLLGEHRHRWCLDTSRGRIVLRRPPMRLYRAIEQARAHIYPRVCELKRELQAVLPFVDGVPDDEVDPEVMKRVQEISDELMFSDMTALAVVEAPVLTTMEDYEELLGMLTDEERRVLVSAVAELSSVIPDSRIDETALAVAERLGIQLCDREFVEAMTVQQTLYWSRRIKEERAELRRAQARCGQ